MKLHEAATSEEVLTCLLDDSIEEICFINRKVLIELLGPDIANRFLPALPNVVGINTTDLLMVIKTTNPQLLENHRNVQ